MNQIKDNDQSFIIGKLLIWINIAFFISRAGFYFAGVRYNAQTFLYFPQLIDPIYFNEHFLQSIFYLHSQPPLFNFIAGLSYKLFGLNYYIFFTLAYLTLGVILLNSMFLLMLRLKIHPYISAIVSALFIVSPQVIIYENWMFYAYPVAVLLCLSALLFHKYLDKRCFKIGFCLFNILMCLVLTRATFHLLWFVAIIALLGISTNFKKVLIICAIPFLIILSLYVKNYALFGSFSTSSTWFGHQFSRMTMQHMPHDLIRSMEQKGKIFSLTADGLINNVIVDQVHLENADAEATGIPVLDDIKKPLSGLLNFNSLAMLKISEINTKDALYVLTQHPAYYLKSVASSGYQYFFPGPVDYYGNRKHIATYEEYYNIFFRHLNKINKGVLYKEEVNYNELMWDGKSRSAFGFVIILFVLTLYYSVRYVLKGKNPESALTVSFILFNIFYISLVTICFGYFGNNRYRFAIDPLIAVLFGLFLNEMLKRVLFSSAITIQPEPKR